MFGNTNFNTSSMVALSTTRADEVLVDVHNSAYGTTDNQPTDNRSNVARSVRFQSPLINNRVVSSSPKAGSNNNPFFQIDNSANISKADDELMELLARISNYVKSRNQGHSGYNGQAAYNQDNRGYEAPTQPSSDLSLVREDAHTEYSTGRVPYTPSSFRLFNDIVKQIPKFDGTPDMLKLFCTAVEEAVEQLPFFEQRIVRALSKLVGDARYIVGKLTGYQCAQELLRDLRDRFVNRNVADGLAMQLGSAKQKAGEDVRKFGVTIRSLYDNAIAAYEQAPDLNAFERESAIHSLQSSVVKCFLYGLLEPLKMEVKVKNPQTLTEAIEIAGETERKLRYRSVTGSSITTVGLIGVPLRTEQFVNTNACDDKQVVCQICDKPGHSVAAQEFEAIEEISNDGNSDVDADGDVSMLPLPEPTAKARAQEKIAEIVNAGKIQLKPAVPPRAPAVQVENLDLQRTEYQSACGDDLISFEEDPCDSTPASASAQSSIENNNSQFNAVPESILDFNNQEYVGRSFPEIVQEKAPERGTSVSDIEILQDIGQPNDNNYIISANNFDTLADETESWNRPWMKSSKHCDAKIVESPEQYRCAEAMPSMPLPIPKHNSIPREAQLGPRTMHGTRNVQQVQFAQHGSLDYDEQATTLRYSESSWVAQSGHQDGRESNRYPNSTTTFSRKTRFCRQNIIPRNSLGAPARAWQTSAREIELHEAIYAAKTFQSHGKRILLAQAACHGRREESRHFCASFNSTTPIGQSDAEKFCCDLFLKQDDIVLTKSKLRASVVLSDSPSVRCVEKPSSLLQSAVATPPEKSPCVRQPTLPVLVTSEQRPACETPRKRQLLPPRTDYCGKPRGFIKNQRGFPRKSSWINRESTRIYAEILVDRSRINENFRANPRGLRTWTLYLIHVRSTWNQCPILEESLYDPRVISVDDPRGYPRNFFQLVLLQDLSNPPQTSNRNRFPNMRNKYNETSPTSTTSSDFRYLGLDVFVEETAWIAMQRQKKHTIYMRNLAETIWTPLKLVNRTFKLGLCKVRSMNPLSPRKEFEPDRYKLLEGK
ncbi:unnamed protein product [Trichogramma brassicae]|uniref:Uncharacterized protein n=1 Tax=Trichogramma brassicae TaxID=86971 RepID=A0A6H5IUI7_9HYME|nr:unnamed protein product [Trichogramma brassicae]